jgi:iron complex outermembrane receptor protein
MKSYIKFLFLIGFISVNAQNSISGIITSANKTPLYGVEIYSAQLHKGTTTDTAGNFVLMNIPNGKINLKISYLGYKTILKKIVISNKDEVLKITLKESSFEIDEIIISMPFNKLQSENVMKVERLSMKSLQKMGATTLIEGISQIAGVTQIATGSGIGKPVIRGLSGNRVLVYTQGIRLENQQFGDEHGLGINEAGISSVEVIKGPASLLYGSDALGGVLYLNPEKYALGNQLKVESNNRFFSNTLGLNSSLAAKLSKENWKFLARGTVSNHIDYKTPTDERVTNTRFNEVDFKTGIGYSKNRYSSDFRYNYNSSKLGITEGIEAQSTDRTLLNPNQEIKNHVISLHNHVFFGNSKLDIDLGYTYNIRKEFEEEHEEDSHEEEEEEGEHEEEVHAALNMQLRTFSYNVKYHFSKIGNLEILSGFQGLQQTNRNFGEELLIPNANVNDFGVFTTANYDWKQSSIQGGIRFDNRNIATERHEVVHDNEIHVFDPINNSYDSFTTSLGFKTTLFEYFTTRINLASGFRAPNLAELTSNGVHHGTNRFEIGNNDLENEKNTQIDISVEYKTEHLEFFINGFHNQINNYIYLTPTGEIEDDSPVFRYVQENARLYGGEIGFHLHPHPADWLHLESIFETVIGKQKNGDYLPLIPANSWTNTFRAEYMDQKWIRNAYSAVTFKNVFSQENTHSFETETSAYNLLHLSFGGDFSIKKMRFNTSFAIQNVLNKKYMSHLSRLKTDGILNQGRNFVLSMNFIL